MGYCDILGASGRHLQTKYCSCSNQGHLSTVCADWKIIVTLTQTFAPLHLKYLQADRVKYLLLQVQVQHSFRKCNFASIFQVVENSNLHQKLQISWMRGSPPAVKLNSNGGQGGWVVFASKYGRT